MPERGNMMGSRCGGSFGDRDVRGTERFDRNSIGGFGREFGSRFDRAGGDRSDSFMVGSQPVRSNNDSRASERGLGGMRGGRGGANAGPLGLVQKVMKKVKHISLIPRSCTDKIAGRVIPPYCRHAVRC